MACAKFRHLLVPYQISDQYKELWGSRNKKRLILLSQPKSHTMRNCSWRNIPIIRLTPNFGCRCFHKCFNIRSNLTTVEKVSGQNTKGSLWHQCERIKSTLCRRKGPCVTNANEPIKLSWFWHQSASVHLPGCDINNSCCILAPKANGNVNYVRITKKYQSVWIQSPTTNTSSVSPSPLLPSVWDLRLVCTLIVFAILFFG